MKIKTPKISHETIVLSFRIVGLIFFLYSIYNKLNQIISLCNVRPKAEKKEVNIDESIGILKSLHKLFSPNVTASRDEDI